MKRLVTAVALALMATSAQATWVDCGTPMTGYVTPNSGCEYNPEFTQDFQSDPLTVNLDGGAFGITDWVPLKKDDPAVLGVWDFGATYSTMMLVYKYGTEPFSAYLVTQSSGTWTESFAKDISHVSYYTVPEPETFGLMFAGLLGLAMRRKVA